MAHIHSGHSLFKDIGELVTPESAKALGSICANEGDPKNYCKSVSVPICKKVGRSSWENHREISLIGIGSELFAGIILHGLSVTRQMFMRGR